MSRADRLTELVRTYFALVDAGRLDEMYDMFSEDVVYRRSGLEPIIGKEAFIAFYVGPRGIATIRHDIEIAAVDGACVALEGRARARLVDGGSFDRRIGEFFWFDDDDLIRRRHGYADVAL